MWKEQLEKKKELLKIKNIIAEINSVEQLEGEVKEFPRKQNVIERWGTRIHITIWLNLNKHPISEKGMKTNEI